MVMTIPHDDYIQIIKIYRVIEHPMVSSFEFQVTRLSNFEHETLNFELFY